MKVCQCWDDGVLTDIRLINILRQYQAKATFNLCPGHMQEENTPNTWVQDPAIWSHKGFRPGKVGLKHITEVYEGFELASHCWQHECAGAVPDEVFLESALHARHFLEDLVQRECRGFAWPCGRYTQSTIDLLRENGFAYARTIENTTDVTQNLEPLKLASCCHFMSNAFWDRFEQAKPSGVFYFWGHSYEMLEDDVLWNALEEKIKTLSNDPTVEWVNVIDIIPLLQKA